MGWSYHRVDQCHANCSCQPPAGKGERGEEPKDEVVQRAVVAAEEGEQPDAPCVELLHDGGGGGGGRRGGGGGGDG